MITIRNLQKKDAKKVVSLIRQLTQNILDSKHLEKRIKKISVSINSQFLVARLNEKVVGFGGLVWYEIPSKGLVGWIEELVVDDNNRGQGIGKFLMKNIINLKK